MLEFILLVFLVIIAFMVEDILVLSGFNEVIDLFAL
jgi:hypothetical protein